MHFVKIVLMILAFAAVSEMDYQDAVKVEQMRATQISYHVTSFMRAPAGGGQ